MYFFRSDGGMRVVGAAIAALLGCVEVEGEGDDEVEPELAQAEQAIEDGTLASSFQWNRAARLIRPAGNSYCTATVIDNNHLLTALHCQPAVGDTVRFYNSASGTTTTGQLTVAQVMLPPGTAILPLGWYDWTDVNGDHADLAVLRLSGNTSKTEATLAWSFPGDDTLGTKVGAGSHGGLANPSGQLRQRSDYIHGEVSDGKFYTNQHGTNGGDSGGPFYVNSKVVGVLTGGEYSPSLLVFRGLHTSVPDHLDFILGAKGYLWPGSTPDSGTYLVGEVGQVLLGMTHRECQYACDKGGCVAYNYHPALNTCHALSTVEASVAIPGYVSAIE